MPGDIDQGIWHLGPRPRFELLDEFKQEFHDLAVEVERDAAHREEDEGDTITAAAFRADLVKFMERAQVGSVREIEFEVIPRNGDEVVELKYPRPEGDGRGLWNLFGWHYRLYAGAPRGALQEWLVWALAGRKRDSLLDSLWKDVQNGHIDTAMARFRRWFFSRCDL